MRALMLLLASAMPLAAQEVIDCAFATECFETEACAETDYPLTLTEGDAGWTLDSAAESFVGTLVRNDVAPGDVTFTGPGASGLTVLTTGPDGARMSIHMPGPMLVTYHGMCAFG